MSVFDAFEIEILDLVRRNAGGESFSPSTLQEADVLLKQMSLEVRSHKTPIREALTVRLARSKEAVAKLRKMAESAQLLGGGCGKSGSDLLQDRISLQNEKILNAQRSVQESESVGGDIIEELGKNRAKIASATGKAGELKGELESAEVKVKSMQSRENCAVS